MSGFAIVVQGSKTRRVPIEAAVREVGADLIWVHLDTAGDETARWLREQAELGEVAVAALTAVESRPRCDAMGQGAFINLRGTAAEGVSTVDPLASVRIYAHAGQVYSVTRHRLEALGPVIEATEAGTIADPGDLIAEFAAEITEALDPMVAALGDSLDDCETDMNLQRAYSLRSAVARIRIDAIGLRRFLQPQRVALEKLAALPGEWLRDDDRLHLSAAADRAARMAEELESIRERAALMHEALTDLRAEQIDQRSLTIAVVAMVFLPLTFLTGLLGMNVKGIPLADRPWAFDGVVAVCVVMAVAITLFFTRRHWLRR